MMLAMLVLSLVQGGAWSSRPPQPSVGDTVWIERAVPAPAGWRLRPGRLTPGENYEPLTDPVVLRDESGWLVRYGVVMWAPGAVTVTPPPVWRLGPAGEADSLEGGSLAVQVRSVIPDTLTAPEPKPALAPLWPDMRRPIAPAAAILVAGLTLAGGVLWRRRGPRSLPDPATPSRGEPIDDARWIAAGEARAVGARVAAELRRALTRVVPAAHPALSTFEVLAITARELPQVEQKELSAVLTALDQVGFAVVHGAEIRDLAKRARALAREFAR
jgi:hypothetical protein